jgi:hypothetical protein
MAALLIVKRCAFGLCISALLFEVLFCGMYSNRVSLLFFLFLLNSVLYIFLLFYIKILLRTISFSAQNLMSILSKTTSLILFDKSAWNFFTKITNRISKKTSKGILGHAPFVESKNSHIPKDDGSLIAIGMGWQRSSRETPPIPKQTPLSSTNHLCFVCVGGVGWFGSCV